MGGCMADVIDFAEVATRQAGNSLTALRNDPYYRFLHSVLVTAKACGFSLPFTNESATEHVYLKTRGSSELARLLSRRSPG